MGYTLLNANYIFGRCNNFFVVLQVVIKNVVYFLFVTSNEFIPGYLCFSY